MRFGLEHTEPLTLKVDDVFPATPRNFTVQPVADFVANEQVELNWLAPDDIDLTGYQARYFKSERNDYLGETWRDFFDKDLDFESIVLDASDSREWESQPYICTATVRLVFESNIARTPLFTSTQTLFLRVVHEGTTTDYELDTHTSTPEETTYAHPTDFVPGDQISFVVVSSGGWASTGQAYSQVVGVFEGEHITLDWWTWALRLGVETPDGKSFIINTLSSPALERYDDWRNNPPAPIVPTAFDDMAELHTGLITQAPHITSAPSLWDTNIFAIRAQNTAGNTSPLAFVRTNINTLFPDTVYRYDSVTDQFQNHRCRPTTPGNICSVDTFTDTNFTPPRVRRYLQVSTPRNWATGVFTGTWDANPDRPNSASLEISPVLTPRHPGTTLEVIYTLGNLINCTAQMQYNGADIASGDNLPNNDQHLTLLLTRTDAAREFYGIGLIQLLVREV